MLLYFCDCLDFVHMYDLLQLRFLSHIVTKLSFLNVLCASQELQYHTMQKLRDHYGASNGSADDIS